MLPCPLPSIPPQAVCCGGSCPCLVYLESPLTHSTLPQVPGPPLPSHSPTDVLFLVVSPQTLNLPLLEQQCDNYFSVCIPLPTPQFGAPGTLFFTYHAPFGDWIAQTKISDVEGPSA